jgi:general stress protein YciG
VAKEDRGFASMDRAKQREIASKGGKAAHQKGTAHEWTSEEARDAGRKGGIASHRRRREAMGSPNPAESETGGGAMTDETHARERSDSYSGPSSSSDDRSSDNQPREERWRQD